MAIKKQQDNLPKGKQQKGAGLPPSDTPIAAGALVRRWEVDGRRRDEERAARVAERGDNARFYFSEAGACSRKLALSVLSREGAPISREPMDPAGHWVTRLGTEIHQMWQEAVADELAWISETIDVDMPAVLVEERLRIQHDGQLLASGYADLIVEIPGSWADVERDPIYSIVGLELSEREVNDYAEACLLFDKWSRWAGLRVVVELKTTGGFSYKLKVGERGTPDGPDEGNLTQLALQVLAADADLGVIVYMATEAISKGSANKKRITDLTRFAAEWSFTAAMLEPFSDREIERWAAISNLLDEGTLPRRAFPTQELPAGAEIVDPKPEKDPMRGRWEIRSRSGGLENTGSWWACGYCAFQELCATHQPGRIPIPFPISSEEEE